MYIYIYIYVYIYIYIYIYNLYDIWGVKSAKTQYLPRLVSPRGFFRVEEFTDLFVFVNYVYN